MILMEFLTVRKEEQQRWIAKEEVPRQPGHGCNLNAMWRG